MKKILLTVLVLILFIAAGCPNQQTDTPIESVFFGGTEGLVAEFEPMGAIVEDGIDTIFDTDSFPIEITLKNRGEEDIASGDVKVSLKGINLNDFSNIPNAEKTNSEIIEKVSEFNKEGGQTTIDFTPTDAKYNIDVIGFTNVDVFANYEYKYKTYLLVPKVCFKEDLKDPSVCDVEENKDFFVSGAPITVTNVEEVLAGKGLIALVIDVKNVGGGDVTKVGQDFDSRYGTIAFEIDEPDKWECKAGGLENEARLVDGIATIRCKIKTALAADELYTKQVKLTISYVYKDLIQNTLKIKESSS